MRPGQERQPSTVRRFRSYFSWFGAIAGIGTAILLLTGDPRVAVAATANQVAQSALEAAANGQETERDQLVAAALRISPDHPLAHGLRGDVKVNGGWRSVDDLSREPLSPAMAEYVLVRASSYDTENQHLRLAEWCSQHQLEDQARAHYTHVLELNPNNEAARKRLQYQLIDGVWYSRDDAQEAKTFRTRLEKARIRWGGTIGSIEAAYLDGDPEGVTQARRMLGTITDSYAMAICESRLTPLGPLPSEQLVQRTAAFSDQIATTVLCRLATYSPWPTVQAAATDKLRTRNEDGVYPVLLGALHSPAQVVEREVFTNTAGLPVVHLVLFREESNQLQRGTINVVVDTRGRTLYGGPRRVDGVLSASAKVDYAEQAENKAIAARNKVIEDENKLVYRVLNDLTGETEFKDATSWWNWWEARNEHYTMSKPLVTGTISKKFTFPPYLKVRTSSCFAAGTPVMTATGLQAIEAIQVGDLVLSQDPTTGALAFKPVLRTTVREDAELIRLRLPDEELFSSGGHRFWVADQGWTRARQLQAGQRLSAIGRVVNVDEAEATGQKAKVYNLVVDGNHTYFVGHSRVLTHDITSVKAVNQSLPGAAVGTVTAGTAARR